MQNLKKSNPKNVKPVTHLPGWLLRWKGKLDSRHGSGACEKYITRLYKKMIALETNEVISTENALFPSRKKASSILAQLQECQKTLAQAETTENHSIEAIRKARKLAKERNAAEQAQKSSVEKLAIIHEAIINANTILDERIQKIRSMTSEKIHSYMTGVRCGKLKDFDYAAAEDDSAKMIYQNSHQPLDRRIEELVSTFKKEGAA